MITVSLIFNSHFFPCSKFEDFIPEDLNEDSGILAMVICLLKARLLIYVYFSILYRNPERIIKGYTFRYRYPFDVIYIEKR